MFTPWNTPRFLHHWGVVTPWFFHHWGVSTPQCLHHRGVSMSWCLHHREVSTPWCLHQRGVILLISLNFKSWNSFNPSSHGWPFFSTSSHGLRSHWTWQLRSHVTWPWDGVPLLSSPQPQLSQGPRHGLYCHDKFQYCFCCLLSW
jgi:hypothetical protein